MLLKMNAKPHQLINSTADASDHIFEISSKINSFFSSQNFSTEYSLRNYTITMRPSNQKSSPSTAANNKSVSFETTARMRLVLHINNYTDEEYGACYYSHEEYCQFKADMKRSVRKMEKTSSETYCCLRGLESFTKERLVMKTIHRRNAWNVVLNKQFEMQSFGGCGNDDENSADLIATAYADTTRECSILAYQIGLSDARFVQQQLLLPGEEEKARRRRNNAKKIVLSSSLFKTAPIATNKKQRIS